MSIQRTSQVGYATVTHVAAELGADKLQRCSRCGFVLKDFRIDRVDVPEGTPSLGVRNMGVIYPEGAHVEIGPFFQAMALNADESRLCSPEAVVDELTYRSYREQRRRFAHIPAARWARVFAAADQLEARYQRELALEQDMREWEFNEGPNQPANERFTGVR